MGQRLTAEQVAWLRREYSLGTVTETAEKFNRHFGLDMTAPRLIALNKRLRFGRAVRRRRSALSYELLAWLKQHGSKWPRKELIERIRQQFGISVSLGTLNGWCSKHRILGAPNTGRFTKGNVPVTARAPGYLHPNSVAARFKSGNVPGNLLPLWSERYNRGKTRGSGRVLLKVPETNPHTGASTRFVDKARWVWQQARGDIPAGHVIVLLDGDPWNCEIDNLECVPRSALSALNRRHAPGWAGAENNPARVRLAQMRDQIARRRRGQ